MNSQRAIQSASMLVVCLVSIAIGSGCMTPRQTQVSKIGVVDSEDVFNRYRKSTDRRKEIDRGLDEVMTEVRRMKEEEAGLKESITSSPEGSPIYEEAKKKLENLKGQVPDVETEVKKLYRRRDDIIAELNLEIVREVRRVASERGLGTVFEKRIVMKGLGPRPLSWPLIHYTEPDLEITDSVVERLNETYLRGKTSGGADEPGASSAPEGDGAS